MEVREVLNHFCAVGEHMRCQGESKGSKADPVTFKCTCDCHLSPFQRAVVVAREQLKREGK
jgi:hypothetical protein